MYHHRHTRTVARALAPVTERRRSCGKRWYDDRIAADLALARIRTWGRALSKEPVRSYLCPGCGGWHLTSVPGRPPIPRPRTEPRPVSPPRQEAA
jgi:hypothetical protein